MNENISTKDRGFFRRSFNRKGYIESNAWEEETRTYWKDRVKFKLNAF